MSDTAQHILRRHGLRITQFRLDTIDLFLAAGKALSSADVETSLPDPDRITLYRTLKTLEDKGIIHKALDGTQVQKFALCESNCSEHHHHDEHVHFHCTKCENTFCLDDVFVPQVNMPAGFVASESNMIVNGLCGRCSNR
jgi:Fur family ferric uptake transcriptional regulator